MLLRTACLRAASFSRAAPLRAQSAASAAAAVFEGAPPSLSAVPAPAAAGVQYEGASAGETAAVAARDASMRAAYDAMPASFPAHAQPTDGRPLDTTAAWRKRLLYRSRQRGW